MFLLKSIDLLALASLFVQALVAWVFVAILRTLGRRERVSSAFLDYRWAFAALALGLTAMCVRFFRTHDTSPAAAHWEEGRLIPILCYSLYHACKALFALHLVRGCFRLGERELPRWLSIAWWPVVLVMALSPLVTADINDLLVIQAPIMIGAAAVSHRALAGIEHAFSGRILMRRSLVALALSWILHTLAVLSLPLFPHARYALASNSFIDLAVQLALGTGIIVSVLQAAHARMQLAEQERERLQRALEHDHKLRALGTLVSGVAHELNNPLTVILGYSELLAESPAHGPAVQVIGEQAERCRGIVRNLSALAGNSVRAKRELDADELVERVIRGLPPDLSAQGKRVQFVARGSATLLGDRGALEQVLTNLLVNALQASPEGEAVEVACRANGAEVLFEITDRGPGVPHDVRARMFEPFFTTKAPGQGTGLGLSIADAIVRGHGGRIEVAEGSAGPGASFRVTIPCGVAPKPEVDTHTRLPAVPGSRLLIVDDEGAVRAVIRDSARALGWSVSEASSAEEALDRLAEAEEPDAVLCDLRMPGRGGAGLHDWLERERPELLERCVFVTGDLAAPESASFARRCRSPLLPKPFESGEPFTTLARIASAPSSAHR